MPKQVIGTPPNCRASIENDYRPSGGRKLTKFKSGAKVWFRIETARTIEWVPMFGRPTRRQKQIENIEEEFEKGEALFDPTPCLSSGKTSLVGR